MLSWGLLLGACANCDDGDVEEEQDRMRATDTTMAHP